MQLILYPDAQQWDKLTARPLLERGTIVERVATIIDSVRREGDAALLALTAQIDSVELSAIEATAEEIAAAKGNVSEELKAAIGIAAQNIERFHTAQKTAPLEMETTPGVRCVQRAIGIERVGLYIPGGSAPLFSTVLMLAIPARIAGCLELTLCTPPDRTGGIAPEILYSAALCGVTRIFKVGGAQAIAAMAYGTATIPKVDKIFGPGNQWVTEAKQQLSSKVAIDMPAGPSEVLVLADQSAQVEFVAADLLSQAEHGPDSQVILVTSSPKIADNVQTELLLQLSQLSRRDTAAKALEHCRLIVLGSEEEMIRFANAYGAEHLIISMREPWRVADQITAAGSVFLGNYTPESAGDYASGTNHTLPTYGWARSYSGVNLDSFMHKITYQEISPRGLQDLGPTIELMAAGEGLDAHKNAVSIRLQHLEKQSLQ